MKVTEDALSGGADIRQCAHCTTCIERGARKYCRIKKEEGAERYTLTGAERL